MPRTGRPFTEIANVDQQGRSASANPPYLALELGADIGQCRKSSFDTELRRALAMHGPAERPLQMDEFLDRLRACRILHAVDVCGPGNVLVRVSVTGERWEIEFFPNSPPEVEVFRSDGVVQNPAVLEQLFERFADRPT